MDYIPHAVYFTFCDYVFCIMLSCIKIFSPQVAFVGENPNFILFLTRHHIQHVAVTQPWIVGRTDCHILPWQTQVQLLMQDWGVPAPWNHPEWWSLTLHSDRCSWAFICWQGWKKKKDSHWKWIHEKSPIPCIIIEEKTISMLIKEW